MFRAHVSTTALLLAAACGSTTPASDPGPTWTKDVQPLVQAKCGASCHVAGGIAPFTLTTRDDVVRMGDAVKAATSTRRMPPYLAASGCAQYANDLSLTDAQISTLAKWLDAGAPEGNPADAPAASAPQALGLPKVDRSLSMPVPYVPQRSPDDYRCFVLDWAGDTTTYVTGFNVRPGNQSTVHHVIAFLIPPEKVAEVRALDAAEPGEGYTCFGGALRSGQSSWLGAWAPGGEGGMFPPGTGLPVKPGSAVVLQVHYNVRESNPRADQSVVDLALAPTVEHPAVLQPFTNPSWVNSDAMKIPAYSTDTSYTFSVDLVPYLGALTNGVLPSNQPIRVHSATLHQHLLGKSAKLSIVRGAGEDCLLDIPRWDFHWQRNYAFTQAKLLRPGDQLKITCSWDNSAAAQPLVDGVRAQPRDVTWGEGTADEMCLGVVFLSQ
ncbi:MAG: hypothetical protein K1X89_07085 [Myxococcaceae bacterium]|nr:hypothetical protein [Myxococcaceae bacterium]